MLGCKTTIYSKKPLRCIDIFVSACGTTCFPLQRGTSISPFLCNSYHCVYHGNMCFTRVSFRTDYFYDYLASNHSVLTVCIYSVRCTRMNVCLYVCLIYFSICLIIYIYSALQHIMIYPSDGYICSSSMNVVRRLDDNFVKCNGNSRI